MPTSIIVSESYTEPPPLLTEADLIDLMDKVSASSSHHAPASKRPQALAGPAVFLRAATPPARREEGLSST